jgi:hypothetical protein
MRQLDRQTGDGNRGRAEANLETEAEPRQSPGPTPIQALRQAQERIMKIRITIEYDLDGTELEDERKQWLAGHVDIADIQAASEQGDTSASVKFEEVV